MVKTDWQFYLGIFVISFLLFGLGLAVDHKYLVKQGVNLNQEYCDKCYKDGQLFVVNIIRQKYHLKQLKNWDELKKDVIQK